MSTLPFCNFYLLLFWSRDLFVGAVVQVMGVNINPRAENVEDQIWLQSNYPETGWLELAYWLCLAFSGLCVLIISAPENVTDRMSV